MPPSAPGFWLLAGCLLLCRPCVPAALPGARAAQTPPEGAFVTPEAQTPSPPFLDSGAEPQSHIASTLQIQPAFGQKFRVPCKGFTLFPESGIMYWLANDSFVDKLYADRSVQEAATKEKEGELTRELLFTSFSEVDSHTKFECIILDPSGVVRKAIKWARPKQDTKQADSILPGRSKQRSSHTGGMKPWNRIR